MEIDMGIGELEFGSGVTRSPGLVFLVLENKSSLLMSSYNKYNHRVPTPILLFHFYSPPTVQCTVYSPADKLLHNPVPR